MNAEKQPLFNLFATTPKGLELLLANELRELGAIDVKEKLAGVAFSGDLTVAYNACLWSRLANSILLRLTQVPANTPEELYAGVRTIQWDQHLKPTASLIVHFITNQSLITHSLFGAQKVKDAIVDQIREKHGVRPSVEIERPDINIHVYLHRNIANISIDLSGESLHRRGYRTQQGVAPIKENLAAAILLRAGWKEISRAGGALVDLMCGSGTFLVEAAMIAGHIAPGLLRHYFGFLGWKKHDAAIWNACILSAKKQQLENATAIPPIIGFDADAHAIDMATANIERAQLSAKIQVEVQELSAGESQNKLKSGLVVVNPAYGERLGEVQQLQKLYAQLGSQLKQNFMGWKAAVFTGNADLAKKIGIRRQKDYALFNGALPCRLFLYDVAPEYFVESSVAADNERRIRQAQSSLNETNRESIQMLINRLQKNDKHYKRQAKRNNKTCYQIYKADLPEYPLTIENHGKYILVKNFIVPENRNKEKILQRLQNALAILPEALQVPAANIFHANNFEDFCVVHEEQAGKLSECVLSPLPAKGEG